jgi:hypothetical protein
MPCRPPAGSIRARMIFRRIPVAHTGACWPISDPEHVGVMTPTSMVRATPGSSGFHTDWMMSWRSQ